MIAGKKRGLNGDFAACQILNLKYPRIFIIRHLFNAFFHLKNLSRCIFYRTQKNFFSLNGNI